MPLSPPWSDPPPLLAAAFVEGTRPEDVAAACALGLDVAELRVDCFAAPTADGVRRELAQFGDVPVIATVRAARERGSFTGTERERVALFAAAAPLAWAVDVELQSTEVRADVLALTRQAGRACIVSFHDFEATPELARLRELVAEARAAGADVVKLATFAQSDADVRRLAELLVTDGAGPLVVIAMGPVGTKSRVFFPALGSRLTFASLSPATAPGQLGLAEMCRELCAYYPHFAARQRAGADPA